MVLVHISAMLVLIGAIALVRVPRLDASSAWYAAVGGLFCIGAVAASALYLWFARHPRTEKEWAKAAIDGIYAVVDVGAKLSVGALAVVVGSQQISEEAVEAAEVKTRGPGWVVDGAEWVARVFGRTLIALAFFMTWALVYLLVWSLDAEECVLNPEKPCDGAYRGVGEETTVGDFLYFSVNAALVNMPPDLIAHSREAHTALLLELLSGVAVVTGFAARFLGMKAQAVPSAPPSSS